MSDIRINALASTATTPASDDYLALDGSANGTRKILATNIANNVTDVILGTSGPSVKSTLSARAPRQGLVFDGTAGTTWAGFTPSSSDFTVAAWFSANSLAANNVIIDGTDSSSGFAFYVATNGSIRRLNRNAGTIETTAAGLIVTGKRYHIAYVRGAFYLNGVSVLTFTDTQNYTAALTRIGLSAGNDSFCTGFLSVLIYNRALSASEVVALYEAGAPSGADYNSASNTSVLTGANSDFSSAGNWTVNGSTTISGGKLNLSNNDQAYNSVPELLSGAYYTFTITVDSITAGTVQYYNGTAWTNFASSAGTYTVTFQATASIGTFNVRSSGGNAVLDTALFYNRGLLLAPDAAQAGGGYIWNDQSGNLAQIVLPSSGVQWNLPSIAGQRIRGTTSTNGNQQLLGASVLLPAECQITHVRARARSGTPTITIGTASGGAQIVASVALSTTWLNCTIALTGGIVSSADDIWVGSNSTDVVETDIAFQPLDF